MYRNKNCFQTPKFLNCPLYLEINAKVGFCAVFYVKIARFIVLEDRVSNCLSSGNINYKYSESLYTRYLCWMIIMSTEGKFLFYHWFSVHFSCTKNEKLIWKKMKSVKPVIFAVFWITAYYRYIFLKKFWYLFLFVCFFTVAYK